MVLDRDSSETLQTTQMLKALDPIGRQLIALPGTNCSPVDAARMEHQKGALGSHGGI